MKLDYHPDKLDFGFINSSIKFIFRILFLNNYLFAVLKFGIFALKKFMRIARSLQLYNDSGYVHKYWKCHNNEFLLENNIFKELYLDSTFESLKHKSVNGNVDINAFSIMDNHSHMNMGYHNGAEHLSRFMRISHSRFGQSFNKINKRCGKVANERPKTPYIENGESLMRVHLYIEANPIRAGKLKLNQLKFYKYSSYMFYAYGIKNKWTKHLTYPEWYRNLGRSIKECQRKYRNIFIQYLLDKSTERSFCEKPDFIGTTAWRVEKKLFVKNYKTLMSNFNTS